MTPRVDGFKAGLVPSILHSSKPERQRLHGVYVGTSTDERRHVYNGSDEEEDAMWRWR